MPASFDACMVDLAASGVDQARARRACMAAFWAETGMFPEEADSRGITGSDCRAYAHSCLAELSGLHGSGIMLPCGQLEQVAHLESFGFAGAVAESPDRLVREVLMLAPGQVVDATGQVFDFTPDDIQAYVDNFDPQDQPPIVLDHALAARSTVGRIRALRVAPGRRLVGLWEILGAENVKPVLDGRWNRTSGRFAKSSNRSNITVIEGSFVWRGAYDRGPGDRAQVLSRGPGSMANLGAPVPIQPPANVVQAADWADHAFLEACQAQGMLAPGARILTPRTPA